MNELKSYANIVAIKDTNLFIFVGFFFVILVKSFEKKSFKLFIFIYIYMYNHSLHPTLTLHASHVLAP